MDVFANLASVHSRKFDNLFPEPKGNTVKKLFLMSYGLYELDMINKLQHTAELADAPDLDWIQSAR